MISAPLRSRASTTTVAAQSPATMRLRAGKRHGAGSTPGAYSETTRPVSAMRRASSRVRGRIVAVDAAAEHGDRRRRPPRARRGAPRRRRRARGRRRRRARRARARGRACARPTRRSPSRRARRRSRPPGATSSSGSAPPRRKRPGGGSWIARRSDGNAGAERARKRKPARGEPLLVRARVEAAQRARDSAGRVGGTHEVRSRLRRVDRECEIAHAASSCGER